MAKCRYCKEKVKGMVPYCNYQHQIAWLATPEGVAEKKKILAKKIEKEAAKAEKEQRKKDRQTLEGHKTRNDYVNDLQPAFNTFIRLRDHDQPCISCGRYDHEVPDKGRGGKWDAGHYRSVGSAVELRFVEQNVHKQCKHCNSAKGLGGNYVEYRKGLIVRIGLEAVERLEGPERPPKMTIPELKDAIKDYRARARQLKKQIEAA